MNEQGVILLQETTGKSLCCSLLDLSQGEHQKGQGSTREKLGAMHREQKPTLKL